MKFKCLLSLIGMVLFGTSAVSQQVRDLGTIPPFEKYDHHSGQINSVDFSPDGELLASASDDRTVKVVNRSTGQVVTSVTAHKSKVQGVLFSKDGSHIISYADKELIVTDIGTGDAKAIPLAVSDIKMVSLSSEANEVLFYARIQNDVPTLHKYNWNAGSYGFIKTKTLVDIDFEASESRTVAGYGSSIDLIDRYGNVSQTLEYNRGVDEVSAGRTGQMAFSIHGQFVLTWNLERARAIPHEYERPKNIRSGKGDAYYALSERNRLVFRKVQAPDQVQFQTGVSDVQDIAFSPDFKYVAVATESMILKVYKNPFEFSEEDILQSVSEPIQLQEITQTRQSKTEPPKEDASEVTVLESRSDISDEMILSLYATQIESELTLKADLFAEKDEFESQAQYEARLAEGTTARASIIDYYRGIHWDEVQYKRRQDSLMVARQSELKRANIRDSYSQINLRVPALDTYNAEDEYFPATINGRNGRLMIPRDPARSFKANLGQSKVFATVQLQEDGQTYDTFNIQVLHPITGTLYEFGTQKEPLYRQATPYPVSTDQLITAAPATQPTTTVTSSGNRYDQAFIDGLKQRKYYALIIGVSDYIDPSLDLAFPLNDAQKLRRVLTERYTFTPESTILLANPTRSEIINAFDELAAVIQPQDQLLVFYAGHGYWEERFAEGYWLPRDAVEDNRDRWIANSRIQTYVRGINSKHTLLISDACFSGSIFASRSPFSSEVKAAQRLYKLNSRKAITSGAKSEVPDNSVFMEYVLKYLEQNTEPFLSSSALFNMIREPVLNNSPLEQVPQYGVIHGSGDEGGDFLFVLY